MATPGVVCWFINPVNTCEYYKITAYTCKYHKPYWNWVVFTNSVFVWGAHFAAIFPINIPGEDFIKISNWIGHQTVREVLVAAMSIVPVYINPCTSKHRNRFTWQLVNTQLWDPLLPESRLLHWTLGIAGRFCCRPRPTVVKVTDAWIVVFQRKLATNHQQQCIYSIHEPLICTPYNHIKSYFNPASSSLEAEPSYLRQWMSNVWSGGTPIPPK